MNVKEETYKHIHNVQKFMSICIINLLRKMRDHDNTKLFPPEDEVFEKYTSKLKDTTYGSDEYKQFLKEMKPALDHHYLCNSHHPEYYRDGIKGMNLIDLIEMLCDWKAATLRHKDGDIIKSIEQNQKRFGYSDELKRIFMNTVSEVIWTV